MKPKSNWTLILQTAAICAGVGLLAAAEPAIATPLLTNLIVNGNAEANVGAATFSATVAPTGWTTTSNFSAVQYAIGNSGQLNSIDSLTIGGDLNYFAGGPANALATARQSIDVADLAASIDAGLLDVGFSAHIGGFASQGDNMTVQAFFLDEADFALLTLTLGPVTPAERLNTSQLLFRSTFDDVPVGTRSIDILMTANRLEGSYNDGYADNLALRLAGSVVNVPEPGSLALLGIALAGLSFSRRKRAPSSELQRG